MHKIVMLGSGDFARGVLDGILASGHQLIGFFPWETRFTPTLKNRLKNFLVPNNANYIVQQGVPLISLSSANSAEFVQHMQKLAPDLIIVAGWGEILQPQVIGLPRVAFINVHPSLLPRHRGSNPIASVLREGESVTGVTYHYLTPQIDAGDIILQSSIQVQLSDDYTSLARKIAFRARETLAAAIAGLDQPGQPQSVLEASYHQRLIAADYVLDWHQSAQTIHNQIRSACKPQFYQTRHQGINLDVLSSEPVQTYEPHPGAGRIVYKFGSSLLVGTGDPGAALLVQASPTSGRLGILGAKLYCLNNIKVGDKFGH